MLLPPQPLRRVGIAGHPPVASGREADGADLRTVGNARALVLLAEESREEGSHRALDQVSRIGLGERGVLAQEEDLLGRVAAANGVKEDEVVQLVGAQRRLGRLLDLARGRMPAAARERSSSPRSRARCRARLPRETRSWPRSGPGTSPASWGSSNSGCTCSCDRHYRSTSPGPSPRGRRCRRRTPAT